MSNWMVEKCESMKREIPEVGQAWWHKGFDNVYIRIQDGIGKRFFDGDRGEYFYSINCIGGIVHTMLSREDIELLDMKFCQKGCK